MGPSSRKQIQYLLYQKFKGLYAIESTAAEARNKSNAEREIPVIEKINLILTFFYLLFLPKARKEHRKYPVLFRIRKPKR